MLEISTTINWVPVTTEGVEQLFDDDATKPEPMETEKEAANRLKILEELIEPSYLDLFRSSNEEWQGLYAALYFICDKLNATVAAFTSTDDQEVFIIDIENIDSASTHNDLHGDTEMFIVGENGELLKSDGR